jgi:hypothetical protein
MKIVIKTTSAGQRLGLVASIITLLGGFSANAATLLIVNETYDPPTLTTPGGWQDGDVTDLSRQYVNQGVGRSTALQVSATLGNSVAYSDVATALFQSGVIGGNEWATRENTVLSFDIKIDQPGLLNVVVYLDAFAEYLWNYNDFLNAHYTSSVGTILLGSYKPGVFHRIVLPLNDPRLVQNEYPDPNNMPPLFDPSARTYNNVTLVVNSGSFAALPASFTITVDNVQVSTRNAMIPFNGTGAGEVVGTDHWVVAMDGLAEHVGSFDLTANVPFAWSPGTFELTAANGDKLSGAFHNAGNESGLQIETGTGRFAGAVGSCRDRVTWGEPIDGTIFPFTMTLTGGISTVGSNKQ